MTRAVYFGFNPPFFTGTIVMPVQTDERLIKNDLIQLLLIVPGERVFRPEFGTIIKPTLFEPIDSFTINSIRESIVDAIQRYEPRVIIKDLRVEPSENNNLIDIKLFTVLSIDRNRQLELELALPTGQFVTETQPRQG